MTHPENICTVPPSKTAEDAAHTLSDLISHLDEELYSGTVSIAQLSCPAMEQDIPSLRSGPSDPSIFPQLSNAHMSIMPSGRTIPLEFSAIPDCEEIYLLTGTRVYFVWPPSEQNMRTFRSYLKGCFSECRLEICQQLEHGTAFIQRPGQFVFLPPHCIAVVFATNISAAVVYQYRRISGLPQQIRYKGLLRFLIVRSTVDGKLQLQKKGCWPIRRSEISALESGPHTLRDCPHDSLGVGQSVKSLWDTFQRFSRSDYVRQREGTHCCRGANAPVVSA
jgi:hypothetical protein